MPYARLIALCLVALVLVAALATLAHTLGAAVDLEALAAALVTVLRALVNASKR